MTSLAQWQNTWQTLGVQPHEGSVQLYQEIVGKYQEPHRHYHTLQHLDECLQFFAELRHLATNPGEIDLALWFHDAIYDPSRHDNEQLSAEWARSSVTDAGITSSIADRIYELVLATRHHAKPDAVDTKILIDVDLAILGAHQERFHEYERQIRNEYAFVPEPLFREKRAEILRGFLGRQTLFNTPLFIERYEQQARFNLNRALEVLCKT
jgi:predicted metal-dependent HD superfamily phosphohydrolase